MINAESNAETHSKQNHLIIKEKPEILSKPKSKFKEKNLLITE